MSESVVYFVRIGDHVKIGVTRNLAKRIKAFQTYSVAIQPLLTIPGDRELEQKLHGLLNDVRIRNEIFRHDWRINGFIDNVEYGGLARGLKYLEETTPHRLKKKKEEDFRARVAERRKSKAEQDAYFASLVTVRKQRLGW